MEDPKTQETKNKRSDSSTFTVDDEELEEFIKEETRSEETGEEQSNNGEFEEDSYSGSVRDFQLSRKEQKYADATEEEEKPGSLMKLSQSQSLSAVGSSPFNQSAEEQQVPTVSRPRSLALYRGEALQLSKEFFLEDTARRRDTPPTPSKIRSVKVTQTMSSLSLPSFPIVEAEKDESKQLNTTTPEALKRKNSKKINPSG